MMPHCQGMQRRLLAAFAGALLLVCALGGTALGDPYGELGSFGGAGTGPGVFKITKATQAFGVETGVEPVDDYIYVGDEPQVGQFRIQKLTAAGVFVAQTKLFTPPRHAGVYATIEGIAVDPMLKRIYVLATERRGALGRDPEVAAVGTLYAFSTEPTGEELISAAGTTGGVLAGPSVFGSQSVVPEKALLQPHGIAVDPKTDDVIVMGEVDQAPGVEEEPKLHVALQRVHSDGTLGERYVDNTNFFGEDEEKIELVNSPVVSPSGNVYVERTLEQESLTGSAVEFEQIVQIPSKFNSTQEPMVFVQFIPEGSEGEGHPVVNFNSLPTPNLGGGLSFAPESAAEETIYTDAHIFVSNLNKQGGAYYPGILALSGNDAEGPEIGWTGGQTKKSASCRIGFQGATYPSVAAGGNHTVFVLDPESAHVVEFGPGGHGCPTAEATSPSATVNGRPLSPSEAISTTTPVTFSSTMTQANALNVEWNFGDGTSATQGEDEYQQTEVEHTFVRSGELTVTETIHTDDLATPTLVEQTKVTVSASAAPPTAEIEGPTEVTLGGGGPLGLVYLEGGGLGIEAAPGGEATFDGSASFDPNPPGSNRIEAYHWVFGDGNSEMTETAIVKHSYAQTGIYKVELTVTDMHELTSKPSILTVTVKPAPPPIVAPPPVQLATTSLVASPVQAAQPAAPPLVPNARLASALLMAGPLGTVGLEVTCPVGESDCAGTVMLRTLGAVSVSAAHSRRPKKGRAAVLTLASGTFTVAGGNRVTVTLRLSPLARALLARTHTVRAQATLAAHDSAGATYSSQIPIVLREAKAAKGRGPSKR
jgi:PKD repeat protein